MQISTLGECQDVLPGRLRQGIISRRFGVRRQGFLPIRLAGLGIMIAPSTEASEQQGIASRDELA